MAVSSSNERTDSPWHDLAIEIYKTSALDMPNKPHIRIKKISNSLYDAFEYFWKTNKYNDINRWFLMLLDKAVQENDELRGLNSQLKHYINDRSISMCALKETLIFCSYMAEISENQMNPVTVWIIIQVELLASYAYC